MYQVVDKLAASRKSIIVLELGCWRDDRDVSFGTPYDFFGAERENGRAVGFNRQRKKAMRRKAPTREAKD